jgi:sodium-dependent dicarboxylate transporter 2/3/5
MMLPIAGGVAGRLDHPKAASRLMLAVAYGASIGGIATLVGTPPNLVLAGMAPTLVEGLERITFGGWMLFGVPFVLLFLPVAGSLLGRGLPATRRSDPALERERAELGPLSRRERRVAMLFSVTALAWITRAGFDLGSVSVPGWSALLPDPHMVSDAVPAIVAAFLATLLPSGEPTGARLLSWDDIRSGVPWGVLLLFGGGFAIADSFHATGLDGWLADRLGGLAGLPLPLVVLAICGFTTAATELTSNTATATLLMPVMAALAEVLAVHPYLLMVPATVSASCAFMLPVATPPNAIVIGSGRVSPRELFREGLWLNLVGALLTTLAVLTFGRWVLPIP